MNSPSRAPAPPARPRAGFTLIELATVMALIGILCLLVVPAVSSLSRANGRKAGIASLLGVIEHARAEAIKSGQATYVVFPTFTGGTSAIVNRFNYKSYAIFEDDPASLAAVKQLTGWQILPNKTAMRSSGSAALSNLKDSTNLNPIRTFTFSPEASSTPAFRCLKFNANGEVESPGTRVVLGIFEGRVDGATEVPAGKTDDSGNPLASEYITVSPMTGRAEPIEAAPTASP